MSTITSCTRCKAPFTDMRVEINFETTVDRLRADKAWESIANLSLKSREILCPECFYKFADAMKSLNIELAATTSPLTGKKRSLEIDPEHAEVTARAIHTSTQTPTPTTALTPSDIEHRVNSQPVELDRSSFNTEEECVLNDSRPSTDLSLFDESIREEINSTTPRQIDEVSMHDVEQQTVHQIKYRERPANFGAAPATPKPTTPASRLTHTSSTLPPKATN